MEVLCEKCYSKNVSLIAYESKWSQEQYTGTKWKTATAPKSKYSCNECGHFFISYYSKPPKRNYLKTEIDLNIFEYEIKKEFYMKSKKQKGLLLIFSAEGWGTYTATVFGTELSYKFLEGEVRGKVTALIGYDKNQNMKLLINEEEAIS